MKTPRRFAKQIDGAATLYVYHRYVGDVAVGGMTRIISRDRAYLARRLRQLRRQAVDAQDGLRRMLRWPDAPAGESGVTTKR